MKRLEEQARRAREIWRGSPCLQDQTWRWGILLVLLVLLLVAGDFQ